MDMPVSQLPRIGLVADSSLHLFQMRTALIDSGYEVAAQLQPARLDEQSVMSADADAWIVSLTPEIEEDVALSLLFDLVAVPVLVDENGGEGDEDPDMRPWQKRLLAKLEGLAVAGRVREQPHDANPILLRANAAVGERQVARNVWVLGASLGGPEAVLAFLAALPQDLPVAFLYAQHIDASCSDVLARAVARHCAFAPRVLRSGDLLCHGQIGIVPVETELKFLPMGQVLAASRPWSGPYAPSIDQVMSQIAELYGEYAGAIVFSGMGEDGAVGAGAVKRLGGHVGIQAPASCISDSMPQAALGRLAPDFSGEPAELARHLAARYAPAAAQQREQV